MSNGDDKFSVWSEYRSGSAADSLSGLDGVGEDDLVESVSSRNGMIIKPNCSTCGRQMQQLLIWPEVVHAFRGLPPNDSLRYSRRGPVFMCQCRACAKLTPTLVELDELRSWIDIGVRNRWIPPAALQAAPPRR